MIDVKMKRIINAEELGLSMAQYISGSIYFSQDEEYLVIGLSNTKKNKE
jgi:hypothetical protein